MHYAHTAPKSWAQAACSGRDTKARSRPPFPLPSPRPGRDLLDYQARSRRQSHVATSLPPNQSKSSRDLKMGLRHQFQTGQVVTSKRGSDTNGQYPSATPKIGCQPNQVATPTSGRDLKTGSNHQNFPQPRAHVATLKPHREALTAKPSRDLKSMSRLASTSPTETPLSPPKTLVATLNLLSPIQPGRDVHFWSRPQVAPQGFQPCRNLKI